MTDPEKTVEKADKLDTLFEMQAALDRYITEERHLGFTPAEWIQKRILALLSELAEVLDEVRFKWWKNAEPIDADALKEELVDVLHFYIGMCVDAGLSADELYEIYLRKNKENYDRQKGLSDKKGYTLAGYP